MWSPESQHRTCDQGPVALQRSRQRSPGSLGSRTELSGLSHRAAVTTQHSSGHSSSRRLRVRRRDACPWPCAPYGVWRWYVSIVRTGARTVSCRAHRLVHCHSHCYCPLTSRPEHHCCQLLGCLQLDRPSPSVAARVSARAQSRPNQRPPGDETPSAPTQSAGGGGERCKQVACMCAE